MARPAQRGYAMHATTAVLCFSFLVFTLGAQPRQDCTVTRVYVSYSIRSNGSQTTDAILTEELQNKTGFCGANASIFESKNTIELNTSIANFDELVKKLETALERGFNTSVDLLPRLFIFSSEITSSNTSDDLLASAKHLIGSTQGVGAVTLESTNNSRVDLGIWRQISGAIFPSVALSFLSEPAKNGSIGNISVEPSSVAMYIYSPKPAVDVYDVIFDFYVSSCFNVSDTSLPEYTSVIRNIEEYFGNLTESVNILEVDLTKCQVPQSVAFTVENKIQVSVRLNMTSLYQDPSKLTALLSCNFNDLKIDNMEVILLTPTSMAASMATSSKKVCPSSAPTTTTNPTPSVTNGNSPIPSGTPTQGVVLPVGRTPRIFVRLRLALTWSQFCGKLEDSLKHQIAKNVADKKNNPISASRIVYINTQRDCADYAKSNQQVDLWWYVRNRTHPARPSRCVTLNAYRTLKTIVDNGNTRLLGTDFEGKVIKVELAGCDSGQFITKSSMPDSTLIIILVSVAVGFILLVLACCCLCCGARRRRRRRSKESGGNLELVYVDGGETDAGKGAKKNKKKKKDQKKKGGDGGDKEDKKKRGKSGEKKDEDQKEDADGDGKKGKDNNGYEDINSNLEKAKEAPPTEEVKSYENAAYGLGDRKPSASYAELSERTGNEYGQIHRSGTGSSENNYEPIGAGLTGVAVAAGTAAVNAKKHSPPESHAPAIVTSPAQDTATASNTGRLGSTSGTPDTRRGSAILGGGGGEGSPGSRRGSSNLRDIDDEQLRERRRSSIHWLEDEAEPLKHKTATVGIVGLALRNKNEKKKETEFKNLDKDMPGPDAFPPNTASKNRNPEILPHPRTRVKLNATPDYINANYLYDHKGQRRYIATQHPMRETMADFWQMVWETGSGHIVMVNDDQKNKEADYPFYWPTTESGTGKYGSMSVTTKTITTKPDYTITTLILTNNTTAPPSTREISHYQFTSWKEKTTPNVALFVGFVVASREVSKKYEQEKDAPVIVHCSDGQGFTGVFVALDIGVRSHEESKTSVVDLFEVAKRLRQARCGIISSLQHYNFIYQCLYEYTVNYDEEAEKK